MFVLERGRPRCTRAQRSVRSCSRESRVVTESGAVDLLRDAHVVQSTELALIIDVDVLNEFFRGWVSECGVTIHDELSQV